MQPWARPCRATQERPVMMKSSNKIFYNRSFQRNRKREHVAGYNILETSLLTVKSFMEKLFLIVFQNMLSNYFFLSLITCERTKYSCMFVSFNITNFWCDTLWKTFWKSGLFLPWLTRLSHSRLSESVWVLFCFALGKLLLFSVSKLPLIKDSKFNNYGSEISTHIMVLTPNF